MDTIAAIATAPGRGGVGIIRISGPDALHIGQKITKRQALTARSTYYLTIFANDDTPLDDAIVIYFQAPNSYTGEDVVEIQAHGSPVVLDQILQESITLGARIANPGEFSERAFRNDKIDLTQAEAIADLINANSVAAAKLAVRSLQGDFSKRINNLASKITNLRLYVEAAIDFPDEEIDFLADGKVQAMLADIIAELSTILEQAKVGAILREGLTIVIAGSPNAGKSTLINYLAKRDVAIVTDVPGTTRDVMREQILIDDIPLHIVDTAGIRESSDVVEQEGIKRAWDEISRADLVLLVSDIACSGPDMALDCKLQAQLPKHTPLINVLNKIDKLTAADFQVQDNQVYISAKSGTGVDKLITKIKQIAGYQPTEGQFLARRRHLQALDSANKLLNFGQQALSHNLSGELLAEDLRQAHLELCKITGEFSADDLLGAIFSSFCIGK